MVWEAIQERFPGTAIGFSCWEWPAGVRFDAQGYRVLENRNLREARPAQAEAIAELHDKRLLRSCKGQPDA